MRVFPDEGIASFPPKSGGSTFEAEAMQNAPIFASTCRRSVVFVQPDSLEARCWQTPLELRLHLDRPGLSQAEAKCGGVGVDAEQERLVELGGCTRRQLDGERRPVDHRRARFDEDYEITQSWQRLRRGTGIQQHDIMLLYHESYEYDLMKSGIEYKEAHEKTETMYNYAKQLKAFQKKEGGS